MEIKQRHQRSMAGRPPVSKQRRTVEAFDVQVTTSSGIRALGGDRLAWRRRWPRDLLVDQPPATPLPPARSMLTARAESDTGWLRSNRKQGSELRERDALVAENRDGRGGGHWISVLPSLASAIILPKCVASMGMEELADEDAGGLWWCRIWRPNSSPLSDPASRSIPARMTKGTADGEVVDRAMRHCRPWHPLAAEPDSHHHAGFVQRQPARALSSASPFDRDQSIVAAPTHETCSCFGASTPTTVGAQNGIGAASDLSRVPAAHAL